MSTSGLRRVQRLASAALLSVTLSSPAAAQHIPAGGEFAVSSDTVTVSPGPSIARNPIGETAVLWLGDCDGFGVCVRTFNPIGNPLIPELRLDLSTPIFERAPAAALSPAGHLLVVWPGEDLVSRTSRIFARTFALDGTPLGPETVVAAGDLSSVLDRPQVAPLPGGGSVVVWGRLGLDSSGLAIEGRRLDAAGNPLGGVFRVDEATPDVVSNPAVAADGAGNFLVAWESFALTPTADDVLARGFDAAGLPLGGEFAVHLQSAGIQDSPTAAAAPGGEFLVGWRSRSTAAPGPGVYARRVTAAGPLGVSETRVNVAVDGEHSAPSATGGGAGFAVVWQREEAATSDVYLRSYDLAGVPQGGEQRVESTLGLYDERPAVAGAGAPLVAWTRRDASFRRQIFARRYHRPAPAECLPSATTLCLAGGRFLVDVTWRDQRSGSTGVGTAVERTDQTGLFWFFQPDNIELVVKVLDGRPVNGHFWVFYGALSDVEYTLTVTDVTTGELRSYLNPPGEICGRGDTAAFPLPAAGSATVAVPIALKPMAATEAAAAGSGRPPSDALGTVGAADGTCTADAEHLCLTGERFRVSVAWQDQHNGGSGVGTAIPFTDRTGFFWFFNPANFELVVKVLDGREVNGHFWVFYGALSDVEYTITVTDTMGTAEVTYHNPPDEICGRGDTAAIPAPP